MTQLFVFRDPMLRENTCTSDFCLDDFLRPAPPWTSLYLVLTPGEEEFVRPFMRMFLRLACQRWMEESPHQCRITLLMDEFTSLAKVDFFEENLARLGGRGIRTLLAVQNIPQLKIYGDPARITEQCKVRVYFGAQGPETGRAIQGEVGTGTATTAQESRRAEGWSWLMADSQTIQEQQHARPLLTGSEATENPRRYDGGQGDGAPTDLGHEAEILYEAHVAAAQSDPGPSLATGWPMTDRTLLLTLGGPVLAAYLEDPLVTDITANDNGTCFSITSVRGSRPWRIPALGASNGSSWRRPTRRARSCGRTSRACGVGSRMCTGAFKRPFHPPRRPRGWPCASIPSTCFRWSSSPARGSLRPSSWRSCTKVWPSTDASSSWGGWARPRRPW